MWILNVERETSPSSLTEWATSADLNQSPHYTSFAPINFNKLTTETGCGISLYCPFISPVETIWSDGKSLRCHLADSVFKKVHRLVSGKKKSFHGRISCSLFDRPPSHEFSRSDKSVEKKKFDASSNNILNEMKKLSTRGNDVVFGEFTLRNGFRDFKIFSLVRSHIARRSVTIKSL